MLDAILRLNGQPTSHQMRWLVEELGRRGQRAAAPEMYLAEFTSRLQAVVDVRLAGERERLLVPGARAMLEALRERGLVLHLVSGTDRVAVLHEAEQLGIAPFFEGRLHGAPADARPYSKAMVLDALLREHGITGAALLGFGDGEVEIRATCAVGGLAVAVAHDERQGAAPRPIDPEKRERLLAAGAQVVIPDYRCRAELLPTLLAP